MNDEQLAAVAKALAHPSRLRIVRLLASETECRGTELFGEIPYAQSTVSQHLALLREAGVVSSHQAGQGSVYCLNAAALATFADEIAAIAAGSVGCSLSSKDCS